MRQFFDFIDGGGGKCNLREMNVSEKLPCATTGDMGFWGFTSTFCIGVISGLPNLQAA